MTEPTSIILASSSPRRRELLAQIGVSCEVRPAAVDETPIPGEPPGAYVRRLARSKANAVANTAGTDARPVLGADTAVVVDGVILGKPADNAEAQRMLKLLSGRTHEVMSAVAVASGGRIDDRLSVTVVTMRTLSDSEIARYSGTDEPYDKAGAYAIQGHAAAFITRIDGSYSGVVGLPLAETVALLEAAGVRA